MNRIILASFPALLAACEFTAPVGPEPAQHAVFEETFADNGSNWFVGERDSAYACEVAGGEYRLRSLNDSGLVVSKEIPIPAAQDFGIRVAFRASPSANDPGYGFCWGGSDAGNRYCFFASRDRQFTVFKRSGGAVADYIPWSPSAALDPVRNTLEIRKRNGILKYVINGKEEGAFPCEPFFGDRFYFAADGVQEFAVEGMSVTAGP